MFRCLEIRNEFSYLMGIEYFSLFKGKLNLQGDELAWRAWTILILKSVCALSFPIVESFKNFDLVWNSQS